MTKPSDKQNNFDELISSTLGRNELKFDFDKWQQDHQDSVRLYQLKTQNRSTPAAKWRLIMKNNITKLATAAVILIALLLTFNHNGVSPDGATIAWADVKTAFLKQKWVHIKYNNGREKWYNIIEGKTYFKSEEGRDQRYVYVDRVINIRHWYWKDSDKITIDAPVKYRDDKIPEWNPKSAWEATVGVYEKKENISGDCRIEKYEDIDQGQALIRFDIYIVDALRNKVLISQIWADPVSRLPVKCKRKLQLAKREEQNMEWIEGYYDFPETGPETIYDLGVPKDIPIVDLEKEVKNRPKEINFTLDACQQAMDNFNWKHRMVVWRPDRPNDIDIIFRNGKIVNASRYSGQLDWPPFLPKQPGINSIMKWSKQAIPHSVNIVTKTKYYSYSLTELKEGNKDYRLHLSKNTQGFTYMSLSSKLEEFYWPHVSRKHMITKMISDEIDVPEGCIGLIGKQYYYIVDPEKDYICVKTIDIKELTEKQILSTVSLEDFSQLPDSRWYAGKYIRQAIYNETGKIKYQYPYQIDIKILSDNEFPPDIFDGEKLMKNAVKIETY